MLAPEPHQNEVASDTDLASVRRIRRGFGSRGVPDVCVGSVVSGVRLVIAVIRCLQWLCSHDAVAYSTQKLQSLSYFSKHLP